MAGVRGYSDAVVARVDVLLCRVESVLERLGRRELGEAGTALVGVVPEVCLCAYEADRAGGGARKEEVLMLSLIHI